MGFNSESHLFRNLPKSLAQKIERSVYNRRRRKLAESTHKIRLQLSQAFNEFERYFVVDSMPLEVCKLSRSSRSTICKEQGYSFPDKGFCAS